MAAANTFFLEAALGEGAPQKSMRFYATCDYR